LKDAKSSRVKSLTSKRDNENSVDIQNESNFHDARSNFDMMARNERTVTSEVTNMNVDKGELLETKESVGAFPIPGIAGRMNEEEELSEPNRSLSHEPSFKELTSIAITSARLVDDDIVNAVPVQGSRYKFIFIVSLILLVGTIILIVVLTRRPTNDPTNAFTNDPPKDLSAEDDLTEKIKLLLTNASRQELDIADSALSQAMN
jgi:hypothetical protein